jgi:hypothetical protein
MSRRTLVLLLVAGCLGAALLAPRYVHRPQAARPARPVTPPPIGKLAPTRSLTPSVAERLEKIDGRMRLPPDRRALAAVGLIHALATGGAPTPAEATYTGSWKVSHEGHTVGVLSPYPSFAALLSLLDEWAAHERKTPGFKLAPGTSIPPQLAKRLARFDDDAAFDVLAKVDASWRDGKASAGDLLAATDALAQLCVILPNDFPAADRIAERALASLALARQFAPERTVRAEALIAYATNYLAHAMSLAERLAKDDPFRQLLLSDYAALEHAEKRGDPSAETDFFYAQYLEWTKPIDTWLAWWKKLGRERAWRFAIVRTVLDDQEVGAGRFTPELYAAVLLTKFGVPLSKTESQEQALGHCDELVAKADERGRGLTGPFADAQLYGDAYRTACLSAVYQKVDFYLDAFGSPKDALAVAQAIPKPQQPGLAALVQWAELVSGGPESHDAAKLAEALKSPSELGPLQRRTLADRLVNSLKTDDYRRFESADMLMAWLDSREIGRVVAGDFARDVYFDPDLEGQLYKATLDLVGPGRRGWLRIELAKFHRDWASAWAVAESEKAKVGERMSALLVVEEQKPIDGPRLRRAYERLIEEQPNPSGARSQYAKCLEKKLDDRAGARAVLVPILADYKGQSISSDDVAARIARLYREDGDNDAAWELLQPRLDGWVGSILSEAARTLAARGDFDRAEKIARASYQRYPDSLPAAADLSGVLWAAKRNRDAAEVIAKFATPASDNDRCWSFCRAFVRTFKDKPTEDAAAAYKELVAAGLDYQLLQGMVATFRAEPTKAAAETAFAMGNLMNFPDGILQLQTEAYKSLKLARGEDEALAWIKTKIARGTFAAAAKLFYFREADELLWKLIDDPDKQGGSATWLLRAAAFVREPTPDESHRATLATYFAEHQKSFDEQLGAALTGVLDGGVLLERVQNESDLSRAAYFLGARAEAARDLHTAMRLYRLALSTHQVTPASHMALDAATRIQSLDASLDALAAEPKTAFVAEE